MYKRQLFKKGMPATWMVLPSCTKKVSGSSMLMYNENRNSVTITAEATKQLHLMIFSKVLPPVCFP